ncbi:Protein F41H8.1 [Aphelenchoides avenae]|nr:Protein F41H8.1 [Aphelenchus avenae]
MQILSIASSGFMVFLFARSRHLRPNVSLWLIFILAGGDLLMAATSIPYVVYLIAAWDENELDYDGTLINILSTPVTMQLKLKPFITSAIALDRVQVGTMYQRWIKLHGHST